MKIKDARDRIFCAQALSEPSALSSPLVDDHIWKSIQSQGNTTFFLFLLVLHFHFHRFNLDAE